MKLVDFTIWKSKNVEHKFKGVRSSDVFVTKATKKYIDYEFLYNIDNETVSIYEIANGLKEQKRKLVTACSFKDIDNTLLLIGFEHKE